MRIYLGILLSLLLAAPAFAFTSNSPGGGGIVGGNCTGGQVMGGISSSGVPTCVTPSAAGSFPAGAPPQIGGFSATNVAEAQTIGGDATAARTGPNALALTVTRTNGVLFTGLATAAIPLTIANGGRGSTTAPAVGQIDVASSTTAFTPVTMSGDATLTSAGVITVHTINGVTPGTLFSAATPLAIALGGRGTATAPTLAGQIDVAQSASAFGAVTMSGDATITATGAMTVTRLNGTVPGGTCGAGTWVSTISASGVPTCTSVPGTIPAPTTSGQILGAFTTTPEWQTMGGDMTLTRASAGNYTATVTRTNGVLFGAAATLGVGTGLASSGGNINLATPVAIASGGTATGTAPTAGQLLVAQSTTAYGPVSMSGDATITSLGAITVTRLNGTVPGGTCGGGTFVNVISASGVPTCAAPPGVLPPGSPPQLMGYSATNVAEAQTVGGDLTLARTGTNALTATVTRLNGTTPGGTCGANTFVNTINGSGVPGCLGVTSLTSPTMSNPTFTGTLNFPDGSTYTSTGHQNMAALGIGQATGSDPLDITRNVNAVVNPQVLNNSAGTSAIVGWQASNGTSQALMQETGTGYTANPNIGANTAIYSGNGVNGVDIVAFTNATTAPIRFWVGGQFQASLTPSQGAGLTPYLNVTGQIAQTNASQTGVPVIHVIGNTNADNQSYVQVQNDLTHHLFVGTSGTNFTTGNVFSPADASFMFSESAHFNIGTSVATPVDFYVNNSLVERIWSSGISGYQTIYPSMPVSGAAGNAGMINNNIQFNVANAGSQELAGACSGLFMVADLTDGIEGLYMCGGAYCVKIQDSANGTSGPWVASTTAPAAGKASVAMNGANHYTLYNNMGATTGFMALTMCNRAGT